MKTRDLNDLAREMAGNWRRFRSFAWRDRPENANRWAIVYTHNRDSSTLDRANAEALVKIMAPFMEDGTAISEHHSHWACGWVDGYAILALDDDGNPTPAILAWLEAQEALEDYPCLDDEVLSRIELEEIDDAWDSWLRRDVEREIEGRVESQFGREADYYIDGEALREIAYAWKIPEHNGREVSFPVKRFVGSLSADDLRALIPPLPVTLYRDGVPIATGADSLGEVEIDQPLYEPEFLAALEAPAEIGGHRYEVR